MGGLVLFVVFVMIEKFAFTIVLSTLKYCSATSSSNLLKEISMLSFSSICRFSC